MIKPVSSKTPKHVYDLVHQREIAIELLPEGEVKERVRMDLARLRMNDEAMQASNAAAPRKPVKR